MHKHIRAVPVQAVSPMQNHSLPWKVAPDPQAHSKSRRDHVHRMGKEKHSAGPGPSSIHHAAPQTAVLARQRGRHILSYLTAACEATASVSQDHIWIGSWARLSLDYSSPNNWKSLSKV